jgi:SAM-dependent methyltransferase
MSQSVFMHKSGRPFDANEIQHFKDRIFKPSVMRLYAKKNIEMSLYIDVNDYDEHEKKHAYYQEMMSYMIATFLKYSERGFKACHVLEFGAGTGIFTQHLAEVSIITKVVAIEIDWHCYKLLERKFKDVKKVETVEEDSRTYDPEGFFDCIFSSFSDHHIDFPDKAHYFSNVINNLKRGGYFIVGDEFLPDHDLENDDERSAALQLYHNHIIDIANREGEYTLATLEQQALDSGLRGIGDFKLSCQQYEKFLREAGFEFHKEKIGPLDQADVGGVYVYRAWLAN